MTMDPFLINPQIEDYLIVEDDENWEDEEDGIDHENLPHCY
tara:strand:- start:199 stop:321 length:123 start_codon:yes stop_codon:yes gene_type:complete